MYTRNDIITKERIESLRKIREAEREAHFAKLVPIIGKAAVYEVRKIYSSYDERMLIWYAGLWEPEIGGFYFSNSARDHEGFLPDLESTAQAVNFIGRQCGLVSDERTGILAFPEKYQKKIADFAYNLQDEDGYFYHPQWGKNVTVTRLGRDLGWAGSLLRPLGIEPKYLRPGERRKQGVVSPSTPEHLLSLDNFKKWLSGLELDKKSYQIGNFIDSTSGQIVAAGQEYVDALVEHLNATERADNGLWEEEVTYKAVNGLMKIALNYPGFGSVLPYSEAAMNSAIFVIKSDEPITFACEVYNAWAAINSILISLENNRQTERAARLRKTFLDEAPTLIRITGEKLSGTAVGDGSFAYHTAASGRACPTSQGAPVALDGIREGDINGNGCSTRAPLRHMFSAFGTEIPPFFTSADAEFFFELLDARVPVPKVPVALSPRA
jgi:hypothetical protein